jgi:MerR family transcriptional regulator, light-induced transcriptional regulator
MKKTPLINIAAVERDVGVSKDVLRVWERRYGFPAPERNSHGERLYPAEQVRRLRLVKRLMNQGYRPGRLLTCPVEDLEELSAGHKATASAAAPEAAEGIKDFVESIRKHDAPAFVQAMQQQLAREGLRRFVQDTVAPLARQIGDAWEQGRLHVFEEHLFTELTTRALRQAIAAVPGGRKPKVLLTTLPNEPHGLGLLMVEAMLSLEGAQCISLGTQMPLPEILEAAAAHRADVVALSFSSVFPARQIPGLLLQLREGLSRATQLWVGGAGVRKVARLERVLVLSTLDDAAAAVSEWRDR